MKSKKKIPETQNKTVVNPKTKGYEVKNKYIFTLHIYLLGPFLTFQINSIDTYKLLWIEQVLNFLIYIYSVICFLNQ